MPNQRLPIKISTTNGKNLDNILFRALAYLHGILNVKSFFKRAELFSKSDFFFHRHVWRKYRNRRDSSSGLPWYRSVYSRDNTAESLHHRPHSGGTTVQSATRILSAQDVSTLILRVVSLSANFHSLGIQFSREGEGVVRV